MRTFSPRASHGTNTLRQRCASTLTVRSRQPGSTSCPTAARIRTRRPWGRRSLPALTTTFLDYLIPTATDVPMIEYGHIETPSPGPGGYKGVGEGGAIGAPPAVVNAVNDALAPFGVTLTELPLTPAAIAAALERAATR
jgi:hypothetical protein